MSQQWAFTWNVRPGTEAEVARLFAASGRPDHTIRNPAGEPIGRLLRTSVFMRANQVVRVIEFDGEFADVVQHMRVQQEVRELEAQLDAYLETPRDMSTPESAATFFRNASMRCLLSRSDESAPAAAGVGSRG